MGVDRARLARRVRCGGVLEDRLGTHTARRAGTGRVSASRGRGGQSRFDPARGGRVHVDAGACLRKPDRAERQRTDPDVITTDAPARCRAGDPHRVRNPAAGRRTCRHRDSESTAAADNARRVEQRHSADPAFGILLRGPMAVDRQRRHQDRGGRRCSRRRPLQHAMDDVGRHERRGHRDPPALRHIRRVGRRRPDRSRHDHGRAGHRRVLAGSEVRAGRGDLASGRRQVGAPVLRRLSPGEHTSAAGRAPFGDEHRCWRGAARLSPPSLGGQGPAGRGSVAIGAAEPWLGPGGPAGIRRNG
jgi:hypothetical protein